MAIFQRGDLLIPRTDLLDHWPVIACDQFTSQPEYWAKTASLTAQVPSVYHIIFPEAELGGDEDARIEQINRTMEQYLAQQVFRSYPSCYVYVERTLCDGSVRKGIVGLLDLESYDYRDSARSPVRATEKTVVSRIPPRVKIRAGASLESSHVLLLCSDPGNRVFDSIRQGEMLYDLELMQGGGHLTGWLVNGENADLFDRALAEYTALRKDGFCFAVGDGNHSLAAAKTCWEQTKKSIGRDCAVEHPARYAMVELENLFDPAQRIEPIHRIVRRVDPERLLSFLEQFASPEGSTVRWYAGEKHGAFCLGREQLPLAALQQAIDQYVAEYGGEIDYIHGEETAVSLSARENAVAFLLSGIEKNELFDTIARGGVLPRKTFSMGHAEEKRYYLECRRIIP